MESVLQDTTYLPLPTSLLLIPLPFQCRRRLHVAYGKKMRPELEKTAFSMKRHQEMPYILHASIEFLNKIIYLIAIVATKTLQIGLLCIRINVANRKMKFDTTLHQITH
ncbi:hypothetical protein Plhal304r1_c017g0062811 [Plasmopara halstedii]